jgi:poly(3-hydroxybutyrate) depolymerase
MNTSQKNMNAAGGVHCFALMTALAGVSLAAQATPSSSIGCGGTSRAAGIHTLQHNDLARAYRLYLPSGYSATRPAPLVIVFHGWGGDENEFLDDVAVRREADAHGYVVVAPRGLGSGSPDERRNSWTFRGSASGIAGEPSQDALPRKTFPRKRGAICDTRLTPDYRYPSCKSGIARNTCSWTQCQDDDVDFTIELLQQVESQLCVDTARVFATGGSNGGMFTWELGQNPRSAPLFRAIAPLIGLPHRSFLDGPARAQGMPVLLITGTHDTTVPPGAWNDARHTTTSNGSDRFYYTGATAITQSWAAAGSCDISKPPAPFDTGASQAECRSYCTGSAERWPAVLDCRAPMGHDYGLAWSWKLILDFFDQR